MENIILSPIPLDLLKTEIADTVRAEVSKLLPNARTSSNEELVTRKEAATILGVTLPTILEWTKKGKIKGYRIGTRIRYKKSEINSSLTRIKTATNEKED